MDEIAIITRLKEIFESDESRDLIIGIGDDAALAAAGGDGIALATDILVEGTHFNLAWSDLYSIGRKAAAANLADIYAMGISAKYLLVAVAFDPSLGESIFKLAQGIADECKFVGARVIGGDLARSQSLTVAITAYGAYEIEGTRVTSRSDVQVGDGLYIIDLPGRSILGLEQLRQGVIEDEESIAFHRAPVVDYQGFLAAARFATSMTDISDGMMIDVASLARASEVTIEIDSTLLKDHPKYRSISKVAEALALDPIELVLTSGEEHSPLFTADPADVSGLPWHRIGRVVARGGTAIRLDGRDTAPKGFQHF